MTEIGTNEIVETVIAANKLRPLSSLSENIPLVGTIWLLSSALFTTYATTSFLKYRRPNAANDAVSSFMKDSPYLLSSARRATTKSRLFIKSSLPRPVLLTLSRFGGSVLLGFLAQPNPLFGLMDRIRQTKSVLSEFTLPAIFLFIANFANSMSLNRIGISLTYTSKCAIPLVTVLLTVLLEGRNALPNRLALLSLVPIAMGIAAASWNSPRFELFGFIAAMISCTAQSALNVTSKRAISKTGIPGSQAQRAMVTVGFVISAVYSLVLTASTSKRRTIPISSNNIIPFRTELPIWLTSIAVMAYHIEYTLSFMFVKLVSPISYGTCDAIRRLSIIITGHYMFGGPPFSKLNLAGIGVALLGAMSYSVCSSR